jgi:para-aminobenzoate synthetase component 1
VAALVSLDAPSTLPVGGADWAHASVVARPEAVMRRSEADVFSLQDPLGPVREVLGARAQQGVVGGVIAAFSYELGRVLEPTARGRNSELAPDRRGDWPALVLAPVAAGMVFHGEQGARDVLGAPVTLEAAPAPGVFHVEHFASATGAASFRRAVARAVEYTHAGDCFQVNLSHRLRARFCGSVRALAVHLLRAIGPSLGAYIEVPREDGSFGGAILSVSPELFLRFDAATRRVTTRPIKGTRAALDRTSALESSSKDAAELAMIVDLMRNDLGRVCEPGSIRVDRSRDVEMFGRDPASAVRHTVATVSGTLGAGRSVVDVLAAAFPPGSVTGAPKIRAMQIIEELEPVERGPYCGAIAWFAPSGDATVSVPIRTVAITVDAGSTPTDATGVIDLHVGAGIVAESDPRAEWVETLHKAQTILAALGQDAGALDR